MAHVGGVSGWREYPRHLRRSRSRLRRSARRYPTDKRQLAVPALCRAFQQFGDLRQAWGCWPSRPGTLRCDERILPCSTTSRPPTCKEARCRGQRTISPAPKRDSPPSYRAPAAAAKAASFRERHRKRIIRCDGFNGGCFACNQLLVSVRNPPPAAPLER